MFKNNVFKKCISLVLAVALFASVAAPAAEAVGDMVSKSAYNAYYVALGDAVSEGYGLEDIDDVYYVKVAEALGKPDDYYVYSHNKLRVEDVRYLLDEEYAGDGYTASLGSMLKQKRAEVQGYVSNAEVITINAGGRNFSTYLVEQIVHYLENEGAVKYSYSFDAFMEENVQDALADIKNVVMEQFTAVAPEEGDKALEFANFVIEVSTYAVMSYVTSFNSMIAEVYELNPDVELYVLGIHNPMEGEVLTFENGEQSLDIPLGRFFGALVELANAYAQVLAPRAYDYTYVDPGNPELLIDQMANKELTDDERFPNGLMSALLDLAGDAALEEVIDIFTEYEIDPSPLSMEDYAARFLDELAWITDPDERLAYIQDEIAAQANKKVKEAFKDKLKEQLGQFADGDKVVTDAQIENLMTDLGAAVETPCEDGKCGACRKCIAAEFVENLIDNPELQKQAAAKLIYNKLGDYGLKQYVTLDGVVQLLTDMETASETPCTAGNCNACRSCVVNAFVHDLAVAKVTEYVQGKIGSGYTYTEAMADDMLTKMEKASTSDEAKAIAKAELWEDIFRQYMIDKIDAKFTENGLEWVNTDAATFVDNIYAAGDNYESVVRATVRASAAKMVADQSMGVYTTAEVIDIFAAMDAVTGESAKKAVLQEKLGVMYSLVGSLAWTAYGKYTDAANTSIALVGQYLDLVDQAAGALAEYNAIQANVAGKILDMYAENYKDGKLDMDGLLEGNEDLKELQNLRTTAVKAILDGYDQYEDALDTAMKGAEQINNELNPVYDMLKDIAEVEKISLNDLLAISQNVVGDESYITDLANRMILDKSLKPEETTAAYIALRYFIGNGMMIMPSAAGHQTIADQIIKAINGEPTNSYSGELANKVIDGGLDIYHLAKEFLQLPTSGSGQTGTLINPDTYLSFGDNVTMGTALNEGEKTYVDLLADALAMEYKDDADIDSDVILDLSFGGMRTEELRALVEAGYNGDAYTQIRYGDGYIQGLREKYLQNIQNADLITVNVGINNLVSYPLLQSYLAYNSQETYEMDWAHYFGQARVDKLAAGKSAINKLLMHAVDVADNHVPDVDGFSAYQRCETLLNTVAASCESLVYGLLGYIVNLDASVEAIAAANPDATIVLVGFYNPMEDTYIHVENVTLNGKVVDLSAHTPINTSALTEKVINIANRVLTNFVGFYADDLVASGEGSRIVTVPVLETELCVSDTNASKDLSTLTDWTEISGLGHEVTIKIPQYFMETRKTLGAALHPNADGHEYIFNQILKSLKYEIHADAIPEDNEKYYGDADPELIFNWDDASSLFEDGTVVNISREEGEDVGQYAITVTVEKNGGYYEIDLEEAVFTIKARPITVEIKEDATIVTGDDLPTFTAVITDVLTGEEIENDGIMEITGVPADSSTAGEYEISANLLNSNYVLQESVTSATLTIEEKIKVNLSVGGTLTGVYGDDHSNDPKVVVTDEEGNEINVPNLETKINDIPAQGANVGEYDITPEAVTVPHGYEVVSTSSAVYTVTARPVNVVVNSDETIVVGDPIPTFTATVTDVATSDELDSSIVKITGVPEDSDTANTYTISAELVNANYKIQNCTNATLTIDAKIKLDVTVVGTLTGIYGDVHGSDLQYVVKVNGQEVTISGLDVDITNIPAQSANVGKYTITPVVDEDTIPHGYELGTVTAVEYEVTARPVNVVINQNATIAVGGTIPGFTATVTDVATGNTLASNIVTITGIPEDSNTAGTYTISAELADSNYVIQNCTNATLTIKDKVIVTIGGTLTGVYGNDHSNDMSVVVTVNGQEVVLPNLNITFTAPAANAAAGEHTITPVVNGTVPANYDLTVVPATYTVTKRPVTLDVTVLDGSTITGTAVTGGSMAPGEDIDVLDLDVVNGQVVYDNDNYDVTINVISNTSRDVYIKIQPSDGPWYYGDVINTSYLVLDVVTGEVVDVDLQVVLDKTQIDTSILGEHIVKVLSYVPVVGYNVQDITAADSTIRVDARPISVDVTVVDGVITEVTLTEGTLASWDVVENMSVSDWISLLGLTVNDEKTAVTSSNANYNVTIDADFQSSYVPNYVCWNTTTEKYYEIVHLAVLEAKPGETIEMLKDSDQTVLTDIYHYAGSVNLINGVTLDLQNYTLKLDSLIGTEGSYLTGTYYDGTNGGKLIVPAEHFVLESTADGVAANAKVLPAWVEEEGAYVFGQYLVLNSSSMNLTVDAENDTLHFAFDHNATKWIRANVMNGGVTDNRMSVEVYLQWETDTGVAYQHFVYTDDQVDKSNGVFDEEGNMVSDSLRYYFSLSAYSDLEINLDTLVVTARIISDCGASVEGTSYKVSGVVSDSTDDDSQTTTPVEYEVQTSTGMVCENVNTGVQYAILHDAILEASAGDAIRMIANSDQTQLKDICPSAGIVTLTNGITLDLQGYALKVDMLFAAEGSCVTADYYNGSTGGKLVVSEKNLILHDQAEGTSAGASELPAWDPNLGCYVFGQFKLLDTGNNLGLEVHEEEDYIYFRFDHNATAWFRGNILNNGVTENDMAVEVYLQWQTATGVAYQYFVYTDEQVDKSNGVFDGSTMVEDNYRYYFTLNGIEQLEIDLDTLVVSARIISNCGSVAQGSEHRP